MVIHFNYLGKEKFAAICCNVGDSLAYVYSPKLGHVREITLASHDIQSNRDMRDALGKNNFGSFIISSLLVRYVFLLGSQCDNFFGYLGRNHKLAQK
jgi:hypothetical protein